MIKVEVVNDEHQEGVRWLKASHNGVAWSLIEFRNNEEAQQILVALQQSVQRIRATRFSSKFIRASGVNIRPTMFAAHTIRATRSST